MEEITKYLLEEVHIKKLMTNPKKRKTRKPKKKNVTYKSVCYGHGMYGKAEVTDNQDGTYTVREL